MNKTISKFPPKVRERAVRLVLDNEGQHSSRRKSTLSIVAKIGCTPQTLNAWVNKAEVDSGKRPGVATEMAEKIKAFGRKLINAASGFPNQVSHDSNSRTGALEWAATS